MRKPDFVIGPKDDPYLKRWWIIPRNPVFNIYLHQMLHDDEDRALHDHPWWNVSIILKGGYWETMPYRGEIPAGFSATKSVWRGPGAVVFRLAKAAHRLHFKAPPSDMSFWFDTIIPPVESWSLFLTGPRFREWGFHCPKGWRRWQDFVSPDDKGSVGPGCD